MQMSYSGDVQRQRLLLLIAVAMTFLSLLAMVVAAAAQESRRACPAGYDRTKQGCVKERAKAKKPVAACGANEVRKGRSCVCIGGYTREDGRCVAKAVERLCGAYEVERNGKCVCERGYERKDDKCVKPLEIAACGPFEVRREGRCVCADGYTRKGGACVSRTVQPQPCGANEVRRGTQCVCVEGSSRKDGACVKRGAAPRPATRDFVPGQLIVGFKSSVGLERAVTEFEQANQSGGIAARNAQSASVRVERLGETSAKVSLDFRTRGGAKLSGAAELAVLQEYARLLSQRPEVEYAHPNWILKLQRDRLKDPVHLEDVKPDLRVHTARNLSTEPNDPVFRSGLHWDYLAPPAGMNATGAWPTAKGDRSIVVAVVDTGLLHNHPDIKGSGNVLDGYDFISDPARKGTSTAGPQADSTDLGDECPAEGNTIPSWHGTHVAGTIGAAMTNNNLDIAGVNWAVSVLPVRALGHCGGTIEDLAAAIRWSAGLAVPGVPKNEHKADIINLSIGIGLACRQQDLGLLIQALDAARKAGSIVVVAAGNEAVDIKDVTPAGCDGVISVAASDQRGHLTPYSNYGNVTLIAPGGDLTRDDDNDGRPDGIWSLVAPSDKYPSGVAAYEGTSMATPHVSAAIALALSVKPNLRGKPDEIQNLLTRSVAQLPQDACSKPCGAGLLDAKRMVEPEVQTSKK